MRRAWRNQVALWMPAAFFLLLGLTGILTIGYRHMLPAIPFFILLAGNAVDWLSIPARRWIPATAGGLLVAWLVVGTLRIFPHQESYFNELAGDWRNWSRILVDSNLDWGQDLPALRKVMDELGIDTVNLGYFGKAVPELYGVRYRPLPGYLRFMEGREVAAYNPYTPEPGWYAISATALRLGTLQPDTTDLYAYFRDLEPAARAGYSIYLYRVDAPLETSVTRPVIVGEPVYRLSAAQLGLDGADRAQPKWVDSARDDGLSARRRVRPAGRRSLSGCRRGLRWGVHVAWLRRGRRRSRSRGRTTRSPSTGVWATSPCRSRRPRAARRCRPLCTWSTVIQAGWSHRRMAGRRRCAGWSRAMCSPSAWSSRLAPTSLPASTDLLAGLYSMQDWARLPVTEPDGTGDYVRMGTIEVEADEGK